MDMFENTHQVLAEYEERFMQARLNRPVREPWKQKDREEIFQTVKEVLGVKEEYIPTIREEVVKELKFDGYTVQILKFESWDGVYGAATRYIPDTEGKKPAILLCNGHGPNSKYNDIYQALARRLVRQGCCVVCPDSIGQGERMFMGHMKAAAPFYCGLSLQGLIVMESMAWVERIAQLSYVDTDRIGACGNSGGGILTLFLSALSSKLAAVASTGYPNEFYAIAEKEREHCLCNMLPHILPKLDMWEIYSLFAPKPLFLAQGNHDFYFPVELFWRNARKVIRTYKYMNAGDKITCRAIETSRHPWNIDFRYEISKFFEKTFGIKEAEVLEEDMLDMIEPGVYKVEIPQSAITVNRLAQNLTGITAPENLKLCDIFKPQYKGKPISPDFINSPILPGRGDAMQTLAQMECFL